MKFPRGKRAVLPLLGALVVVAVVFGLWRNSQPWIPEGWTAPLTPPPAYAQTGGVELHGWAWSDNIGWISFNSKDTTSTSTYAVSLDLATGNLWGYAWSNNIGWIQFDPASAPPPGTAKMVNGTLIGWARAIAGGDTSASDGWDGWIKLSDAAAPAYGVSFVPGQGDSNRLDVSTDNSQSFAWGSTVVGWLSMHPSFSSSTACPNGGVCIPGGNTMTVECQSPAPVLPGGSLTWTALVSGGGNSSYLWSNGSNPSLGTQSSYTIPNVQAGQTYGAGLQVRVTDGTSGQSKTTNDCTPVSIIGQATLTVTVNRSTPTITGTVTTGAGSLTPANNTALSYTGTFTGNTSIPLSMNDAPSGTTFSWSGACTSSTKDCTFTMPSSGNANVTLTLSPAPADFNIKLVNCYPNPEGAPSATDCIIKIDDSGGSPTSTVGKIQITPSGASPVTVTLTGEINQGSNSVLIRPHTDVNPCDPNNVTSECTGYFYYFLPGLNDRVEAVRSVPLGGSTISFITTIGVNYDIPIGQYYYPITIRAQSSTGGPKTATGWLLFINNSGSGQTP